MSKTISLKLLSFLFAFILLSSCGAVQSAIETLASIDSCQDFDSISSELNEACRDLEGLLPSATDNLTSKTQILSVVQTSDDNYYDAVLLITDSDGSVVTSLDSTSVVAERSSDGSTFTSVTPADFDRYDELATTDTHLSFVPIVDYSGSVLDSDLAHVNSALETMYDNLPEFYRSEVVKFSSNVGVYPSGGFTSSKTDLVAAVKDTNFTRSSTAMYDGIYEGVEDLASETTTLRLAILFTDGQDNDSTKSYENDVKPLFQNNDIPVCVIGVGFTSVETLSTIASDSGCFYIYKPAFSDLGSAFTTVVNQIKNLYRVRFNASDLSSNDTLRFTVTVSGESSTRQVTATVP